MKRVSITVLLAIFWGVFQITAQGFKAHLALGVNITDDSRTEFGSRQVGTRMGLNFGPGVTGRLSKNLDLSVEMLYSQNGSYTPLDEISSTAVDKIALHYLELPITLAYGLDIRNDSEAELSKLSLGGGISNARLFDYKIIAIDGSDLTDATRFDQTDAFLFHIGVTSFFSKSFALNGKGVISTFGEWTVAIRLLYRLGKK